MSPVAGNTVHIRVRLRWSRLSRHLLPLCQQLSQGLSLINCVECRVETEQQARIDSISREVLIHFYRISHDICPSPVAPSVDSRCTERWLALLLSSAPRSERDNPDALASLVLLQIIMNVLILDLIDQAVTTLSTELTSQAVDSSPSRSQQLRILVTCCKRCDCYPCCCDAFRMSASSWNCSLIPPRLCELAHWRRQVLTTKDSLHREDPRSPGHLVLAHIVKAVIEELLHDALNIASIQLQRQLSLEWPLDHLQLLCQPMTSAGLSPLGTLTHEAGPSSANSDKLRSTNCSSPLSPPPSAPGSEDGDVIVDDSDLGDADEAGRLLDFERVDPALESYHRGAFVRVDFDFPCHHCSVWDMEDNVSITVGEMLAKVQDSYCPQKL